MTAEPLNVPELDRQVVALVTAMLHDDVDSGEAIVRELIDAHKAGAGLWVLGSYVVGILQAIDDHGGVSADEVLQGLAMLAASS